MHWSILTIQRNLASCEEVSFIKKPAGFGSTALKTGPFRAHGRELDHYLYDSLNLGGWCCCIALKLKPLSK